MQRFHVHRHLDDLGKRIAWEHFHTLDSIPVFNEAPTKTPTRSACFVPIQAAASASAAFAAFAAFAASAACCAPALRGKPIGISVNSPTSCCWSHA